ncbi:MAG: hypothetical protein JW951_04215 [Lentisphaerae bacterium]|nr:hypothetical protein [Lentisphaerota bacterium]
MTPPLRPSFRLLRAARGATLALALLGPVLTLGLVLADRIFGALVVVMTWLPCFLLALVFQTSLVCPRCGRPCFRTGSRWTALYGRRANLFASACLHCGARLHRGSGSRKAAG